MINRNLVFILFLIVGYEVPLAQSVNIFTEFETLYEIDYQKKGLVPGHIKNMTYLYDEFEDDYEIFPDKEYFMELSASGKNNFWYSYALVRYNDYSEDFLGDILLIQRIAPSQNINGNEETNFLISGERVTLNYYATSNDSKTIIAIEVPSTIWLEFYKSNDIRYRLNGEVRDVEPEAISLFKKTISVLYDIKEEVYKPNLDEVSDLTKHNESEPYEIQWEGDIERIPLIQPLPNNVADIEAVITVRIEIRPNGTVGRIIPLRKMSPELETEVMRTLRSWRFNNLPTGIPQQPQWGTITFRFITD